MEAEQTQAGKLRRVRFASGWARKRPHPRCIGGRAEPVGRGAPADPEACPSVAGQRAVLLG